MLYQLPIQVRIISISDRKFISLHVLNGLTGIPAGFNIKCNVCIRWPCAKKRQEDSQTYFVPSLIYREQMHRRVASSNLLTKITQRRRSAESKNDFIKDSVYIYLAKCDYNNKNIQGVPEFDNHTSKNLLNNKL